MSGKSCENCGKVYNQYLGDRFWSGRYHANGETFDVLCNGCHRELIRDR